MRTKVAFNKKTELFRSAALDTYDTTRYKAVDTWDRLYRESQPSCDRRCNQNGRWNCIIQ